MAHHETSNPEIVVSGLEKSFGTNRVLDGIELAINAGEMVAIVGGSGSGKTVLLNHILGQLKPDAGRVLVANHEKDGAPLVDMATIDERELDAVHTHWGVVFQNNALFSGSVMDNMSLWLDEIKNLPASEIAPIATGALEAVGLPGDDGFLSMPVADLSGGMAKRLAVARAIAMRPNVIFYDEPTTGLDPSSAQQIQDLIKTTHSGRSGDGIGDGMVRTSIIITHDKDLLKRLGPRIVMLFEGRVFFDGTLDEFEASSSPIIRPYFELMAGLHSRPAAN